MSSQLSAEQSAALLTQAETARRSGNFEAAAKLYRDLASDSDDKSMVSAGVEGLQNCGFNSAAIPVLERAISRWPESPMFRIQAVAAYEESGNFEEAANQLESITSRYPEKSRYWSMLGQFRARSSDWEAAERAFAQALSISPMDAGAAINRGDTLVRLGRVDEAITCYRRVTAMFPDNVDANLKLGNLLSSMGSTPEAISVLKQALYLEPANAAIHTSLGAALHFGGSDEDALKHCNKALEIDPDYTMAREALALILVDKGEFPAALGHFKKFGRDESTVAGLIARYRAEIEHGNVEDAERALQRALSVSKNNGEARHLLAALHAEPLAKCEPGFVESIYTRAAQGYDRRMTTELKYQMPHESIQILKKTGGTPESIDRWLDLGCGTGLVSNALLAEHKVKERIGVDLCKPMLNRAAQGGGYNHLIQCDAADLSDLNDELFDLITAIDMIPYIGDLRQLSDAISANLRADGSLAITAIQDDCKTYRLTPAGRFAHNPSYIEKIFRGAGMNAVATENVRLRFDKGEDLPGILAVYVKNS